MMRYLVRFLLLVTALLAVASGNAWLESRSVGLYQFSGGYQRVDLKALGDFTLDPERGTISDVPARFRELDGRRIEADGFMWDVTATGNRVRRFQFVYEIRSSFGRPPLVQERIFATVPRWRGIAYLPDLCRLYGTLHVNVVHDASGVVTSVFTMDVEPADDADTVIPKTSPEAVLTLSWEAGAIGWLLVGICVAATKHTQSSNRKQGCCPVCGHDLRATPNRCPECGTDAARASEA
jgi:hypothetical protein